MYLAIGIIIIKTDQKNNVVEKKIVKITRDQKMISLRKKESIHMGFRCTPPTKDPVATLAYKPWTLAIKPFQVAPQTWYVAGQTWVGCYLIDTGDGLILIDTAITESLYMLVDSIYRLGYKPEHKIFM